MGRIANIALPLLALSGTGMAKLAPITMKGQKFFYENGTQFFMKGVAYQQDTAAAGETNEDADDYMDPLADTKRCKADIPLLKEVGTNIIRTYAIDPEKDHSTCMGLLDDAGIYVISDLSQPQVSINRDDPKWNVDLYERYTAVVDEMARYDNVIGFFAGNEVSNNASNTDASAFVKAAVRDTKKHIADKGYRWLGVGYASNDDEAIRDDIAAYFDCGAEEERIDYWGYNIYSWCGESTMEDSGYNKHIEFFKDYSRPVFMAEYGCNEPGGAKNRIFQDTQALYNDQMSEVFSGGIMYMYFQEENDYGIVDVRGGSPEKQKDFKEFKKQQLAADPKGVDEDEYTAPAGDASECPSVSESWNARAELPPTPSKSLCECMVKSRSCIRRKGLSEKSFGDIFGYICGEDETLCAGIRANATTGVYGAYSMCDDGSKLDFVLDAWYQNSNGDESTCDFDGDATTQSPNTASSCEDALAAADEINEKAKKGEATGSDESSEDDDSLAAHTALSMGLSMVMAVGAGAFLL